ncbi:MAG: hypothetical protein WCF67_11895 [Chitinophagaceae bacterium]
MSDVFETIEAYLDGSLSAGEKRAFEERLKTDAQLAQTFREYQGIESSMRNAAPAADEAALKDSLQQLRKKYFTGKRSVTRDLFINWRAIAALVLIIAAAAIWLTRSGDINSEELYLKYAQHSLLDNNSRGAGDDSLATRAARAFNARQYPQAVTLLRDYLVREPGDIEMQLAQGISYMEMDSLAAARQVFNNIAGGQTAFVHKAQWYLALTYLKEKNYDQCKRILAAIPQDAEVYDQAQALLKEL